MPDVTIVAAEPIPQASPGSNYLAHRDEIDAAIWRVLRNGRYILGPEVQAFEAEFASYLGVSAAVGVGSGTDALELALRSIGVGPGDGVYTVSHTAVATVAAIEACGAQPILIDVDPLTFTLDPQRLREAVAGGSGSGGVRPRAVVPVHLYGHAADMPAIAEIAAAAGLDVVEDCAQSCGARLAGRAAGSWGRAAAFSFYPTKNLGALGDGGLVATNDQTLADRVRELRQYGWRQRFVSAQPGINSRLDELQAAVLRVKLPYVDKENDRRRWIARQYSVGLTETRLQLPQSTPDAEHVYHQYVVRSSERDALASALANRGIGTAVHYPIPVHLQPGYVGRVSVPHRLEQTERLAGEILSLPMYPELAARDVDRIVSTVRALSR